jgi:glutamate synthase domain-containing protein 1
MCGLAGIVLKEPGPLGELLVRQGAAIRHRGYDSTGFALYGPRRPQPALDVHARGPAEQAVLAFLEDDRDVEAVELHHPRRGEVFIRVELAPGAPLAAIVERVEAEGGWVHGAGTSVRVVKDLGTALDVDRAHGVGSLDGTHGIVHCRLATESKVDVDYSHPFWARPFPDITVVHHGHITNYDRLRRIMVGRGYQFATGNDSELAAVWLAERMSAGLSFEEALREAAATFDGTFLLLFGTPDGIGAARDKYGACPLVIAEDERAVAFGSEMRAVLDVVEPDSAVVHMPEEEVLTWSVGSTVTT